MEDCVRLCFTFNEDVWDEYMEVDKELFFQRKLYISTVDHLSFESILFGSTLDEANRSIQALTELFCWTINLKSIKLVNCFGLSDELFTCLPSNLQRLRVCSYSNPDSGLMNAHLKIINERIGGSLMDLALKDTANITDDGMKYIPTRITRLTFRNMDNITNEALRQLPSSIVNLKLGYLAQVTSLLGCSMLMNLRSLQIEHVEVGDESIVGIGSRLTSLELINNEHITDDGLSSHVGHLRHLKIDDRNLWSGQAKITYRTISRATQLCSLVVNSHFGVEEVELSQQLTRLVIRRSRKETELLWKKRLPESLREITISR